MPNTPQRDGGPGSPWIGDEQEEREKEEREKEEREKEEGEKEERKKEEQERRVNRNITCLGNSLHSYKLLLMRLCVRAHAGPYKFVCGAVQLGRLVHVESFGRMLRSELYYQIVLSRSCWIF